MQREYQLFPGVYVTDFGQNCQLKGKVSQIKTQAKDVNIILDKLQANETKINELILSIQTIKQQQYWEIDQILLQTIQQNYEQTIKLSGQMKQLIINLTSIKYKAQSDKIENLINPQRIQQRQNLMTQNLNVFYNTYDRYIQKHYESKPKIDIEISSQNDNQTNPKQQYIQQNISTPINQTLNQNYQQKQENQDQGIYL